MLQNAYLVAKIGADTAENERNLPRIGHYPTGPRHEGGGPRGPGRPRRGRSRRGPLHEAKHVRFRKILHISKSIFAKFWRARSRLYQNEILQENMRFTAFFKFYKICILLHRSNLKILAKNRFEKSAIFMKIQQTFCKCRKI